ncbi:hypothetical protein [Polaribacter staleyi]|uniref:hypothetical protein n=1 Tax=Polaribacter staleyi TaxID=2022337 RepID=UPI0031B9BEAC
MVSIFKTSVKRKAEIELLKPYLDELLSKSKWNFDLEDCDKILRIEDINYLEIKVVELLESLNFKCVELE